MLTTKSDDVLGRVKLYEAIVKGEKHPRAGHPRELQGNDPGDAGAVPRRRGHGKERPQIEMRDLAEDVFRAAEQLGIDLTRPERGGDEDDERRRGAS
jgi:DNA-directed RNA polymerase subunit beta